MNHAVVLILISCVILGSPISSRNYPIKISAPVADEDSSLSQENHLVNPKLVEVFRDIEQAILSQDAKSIARFFGKQIFLGLEDSDGAYYSANQALLILENFFHSHRILTFKLSSISSSGPSPYATGGGLMKVKNTRKLVQIYIAMTMVDHRWIISQLNVY